MTMRERLQRKNRRDDRTEIRRRLALVKNIRKGNVVTKDDLAA